ncbi:PD-(D/E)XK nuclease family protein [Synechococcus sp. PCC 7336]|uniref:RecB family exonuclease n=1 Tax=Synechococcus sp. PCC 7336 TaxID=195250 RepID=UPI00034B1B57|nr:PD-(D/E)XK nuclease family protein [Synechococcus sp. PCC 7336]
MAYLLSATKLQTYQRCPQSYYFKYERKVAAPSFFGSPQLGLALHRALAAIYGDWDYGFSIPDSSWIEQCWEQYSSELSPTQVEEGHKLLLAYYRQHIATSVTLHRPLGIEGRFKGELQVGCLQFKLTGRYDRLDFLHPDGLHLVDYKLSRPAIALDAEALELQLGLYYLALRQTYGQSLKRLTLIFLRDREADSYEVTPAHEQRLEEAVSDLADRLVQDSHWPATPGEQCDRCGFAKYCAAVRDEPLSLPETAARPSDLQLAIPLARSSSTEKFR